jgi:hypothetical protein
VLAFELRFVNSKIRVNVRKLFSFHMSLLVTRSIQFSHPLLRWSHARLGDGSENIILRKRKAAMKWYQ